MAWGEDLLGSGKYYLRRLLQVVALSLTRNSPVQFCTEAQALLRFCHMLISLIRVAPSTKTFMQEVVGSSLMISGILLYLKRKVSRLKN